MKKLSIAFLAMASALAITPTALKADTITISFTADGGAKATPVTLTAGGEVSFNTGALLEVYAASDGDSDTNVPLTIAGADVTITAVYNGGTSGFEDISISSPTCGGVCVTGILNTGFYTTDPGGKGKNAGFGGAFTVTGASATLLGMFGDAGFVADSGSDAFATSGNTANYGNSGTTLKGGTAQLSGGEVDFEATPEPSSLLLLGTGLLGLAFLVFRKGNSASGLNLRS